MKLDEAKKENSNAIFDQKYPTVSFEKVLNYFKLSQKIFGQEMTRYFALALARARKEKFSLDIPGSGLLSVDKKLKKNEIIVKFNGQQCEIQIIRFDALFYPEVILRQEYTIAFDINKDDITLSLNKDKISLKH